MKRHSVRIMCELIPKIHLREEKRIAASEIFTKSLTRRQRHELNALARRSDAALDSSDAPALGKGPVIVGKFYRRIKKLVNTTRGCGKMGQTTFFAARSSESV
jgi:hypothetical protein